MTRGTLLHLLASIVAVVALTVGTSAASVVMAGPRDGNDRTEVQRREKTDGTTDAPPVSGETPVAQEPPSLEFGSAAAGEAPTAGPAGTVEEIEPIIEEPSQEQIDAVQDPVATESLPADQMGERDSDDDIIPDAIDNCPSVYNIDQSDDDGDGTGNVCAAPPPEEELPPETDTDGDGVPDYGDNCWQLANPTQKDGDGDGLGNGCDEGSAPFLTPDEDEVAESQRFVEDPTLSVGDPAEPVAEAAPLAPDGDAGAPIEVTEGATVALPDERGQDRERNRDGEGQEDPTGTNPTTDEAAGVSTEREATSPAGNGDGGRRDETREGVDDGSAAGTTLSGGNLSKVQQGERPRRNPDLTEESGPVLPPPRSSRRYSLEEPGFETVIRIDAGALGSGEADSSRGRGDDTGRRSSGVPRKNVKTEKRSESGKTSDGSFNSGDSVRERQSDAPRAETDGGRTSPGPVPIEAGSVIESSEGNSTGASADEPGDGEIGPDSGRMLRNTIGWQANPDPVDAQQENGDEQRVDSGGGETSGGRRADSGGSRNELPAWDRDRHYKGGEATKRAEVEEIAGTSDDDLYLTQRSGKGDDPASFIYAIPVSGDGVYRVRLHFAETSVGADGGGKGKSGERVFDVDAEGEPALEGFDIYDEVGSMTAVVKTFDIEVDDGTLELEFVGQKGQPVVSAIEVLRRGNDAADDVSARSN